MIPRAGRALTLALQGPLGPPDVLHPEWLCALRQEAQELEQLPWRVIMAGFVIDAPQGHQGVAMVTAEAVIERLCVVAVAFVPGPADRANSALWNIFRLIWWK